MIPVFNLSTKNRQRTMSSFLAKVLVCSFLLIGTLMVNVSGAEEVSIYARDELLPKVLLRLEKASGIRFIVSDSLLEENISADIRETSWTEAAHRLLDGFNLVELADGENNLIKVFLLSKKTGYVPKAWRPA